MAAPSAQQIVDAIKDAIARRPSGEVVIQVGDFSTRYPSPDEAIKWLRFWMKEAAKEDGTHQSVRGVKLG